MGFGFGFSCTMRSADGGRTSDFDSMIVMHLQSRTQSWRLEFEAATTRRVSCTSATNVGGQSPRPRLQ